MTDILKGRRLFQPFGDWHAPISKIPKLKCRCPKCESQNWNVGSYDQFMRKCTPGDDESIFDYSERVRKKQNRQLSFVNEMGYMVNYAVDR